ncbi:MAG: hypothetical protein JW809_17300 [Pirellulales bacterium]|nr:hypothetical protein [Pirellulales bacterium]
MGLFSANKKRAVQAFVIRLLNTHCPNVPSIDRDETRRESRDPLTLAVLVVPSDRGQPNTAGAFTTVTKEFSTAGVSLVMGQPRALDEVFLVFRQESQVTFVRARAKHQSPIGAGFFQLGMELLEIVPEDRHLELKALADELH